MPRGKKKTAQEVFAEQIGKIDRQVEIYKDKISTLETKKKELLEQKKKKEIEELYQRIQESGRSVGEILTMIEQK